MDTNHLVFLLLEDNPDHAELFQANLQLTTYANARLIQCDSFEEGSKLLHSNAVDLIFIDLSLKDTSIIETLDRLPEISGNYPTIVITSLDDNRTILEIINKGADDCLPKSELNDIVLERTIHFNLDRWNLKRQLVESKQQLKALVNAIPLCIYQIDLNGKVKFVNKALCHYVGITLESILDKPIYDIYPAAIADKMRQNNAYVIETKRLYETIEEHQSSDADNKRYMKVIKIPITDMNHKITGIQGVFWDITEEKQREQMLEHSAKHDSLTDLPNRFLFNELLQNAMHRANRSQMTLAILYIDLDGFKEINDHYGHDAGDYLLITISNRMKQIVRQQDIIARLGGDEFIMGISDMANTQEITIMLQRLLNVLNQPISYVDKSTHQLHVSASIGVTLFPQNDDIGPDALLRQADKAMYEAKSSGKNQYCFYNLQDDQLLREFNKKLSALRQAVADNEFVLYYQPKIDMKNGTIVGFEALLRWNHPEKGLLYPDSFLPRLHEEKNLMLSIDHWVFQTAYKQLSAFNQQNKNYSMSINVSAYQFQDNLIVPLLTSLQEKYPNVQPHQIEIEILETHALDNLEMVSKTVRHCQEMGYKIALDDFGTGFATLSYLKELPVNILKIDKFFILEMLHESANLSIVEAAIGLARAFHCDIVAEGIEDIETGKLLLQLGCQIAQGYAISKAISADYLSAWISDYTPESRWLGTQEINYPNRSVLLGIIEHRHCVFMLKNHLQNPDKYPKPELDIASCRLTHWLLSEADQSIRQNPMYDLLIQEHNKIHQQAQNLIDSNDPHSFKDLDLLYESIIHKMNLLVSETNE